MIAGEDLARWLGDRAAQQGSLGRVQAAADKWSLQPLMTQLEREVQELEDRTPENLLAAARRFLNRTGDVDALVQEQIALSRMDPFFRPPFHPVSSEVHNSLLLYHHPDLSISFGVTGVDMLAAKKIARVGGASINFTGLVTLLRFPKAGDAILSFWECDPIGEDFTAESVGPCRMTGRRRIEDGEELVIDGRHQSFVIEHASRDILFFQAVARAGCAPVGTEYDSDSLQLIGASSTDEPSSRIQMMVSLLRALGRDDAFPLLEESLRGAHFYTRWHIMREMLAMDAEASLPALRRMADGDPHPDVRAAARQTIDLFFEAGDPSEEKMAAAGEEGMTCHG